MASLQPNDDLGEAFDPDEDWDGWRSIRDTRLAGSDVQAFIDGKLRSPSTAYVPADQRIPYILSLLDESDLLDAWREDPVCLRCGVPGVEEVEHYGERGVLCPLCEHERRQALLTATGGKGVLRSLIDKLEWMGSREGRETIRRRWRSEHRARLALLEAATGPSAGRPLDPRQVAEHIREHYSATGKLLRQPGLWQRMRDARQFHLGKDSFLVDYLRPMLDDLGLNYREFVERTISEDPPSP